MRFRIAMLPTLSLLVVAWGAVEAARWPYDNLHAWTIIAAGLIGHYVANLWRFNYEKQIEDRIKRLEVLMGEGQ